MAPNEEFRLRVSPGDRNVAYLMLPGHPGGSPGVVKRSVSVRDLIGNYVGPDVMLDFGDGDVLIGVEIVG